MYNEAMDDFLAALRKAFKGDIHDDDATLDFYSHDASLFEVKPKLVVCPQDSADVSFLVKTLSEAKKTHFGLSLTARSAGTDMSGGAVNDSVIVDFSKHFTQIESASSTAAQVQPGVLYRNFELETLKHGSLLPPYPASRELCTL